MSDKPHFRFYPNAYAEGGPFKPSQDICDICGRASVWLYTGEIYTEGDAPIVCARCMADGSLRRRLPKEGFVLQDTVIDAATPPLTEEVLTATPGVASFNAFEWPVIEGEPLMFLGSGDDEALKTDKDAKAAIEAAADGHGVHANYALVFRTLDGETTIAVLDFD